MSNCGKIHLPVKSGKIWLACFVALMMPGVGAIRAELPYPAPASVETAPMPRAYSLVMTNGYGDCYRMNMLRDRANYQAYRGICSYRGFSLSGCSTTGEVVMLRIRETSGMPEHFSILSTSLRWGTTMYVLNDVFRPLNSWVMAGYENWYPFDMSCSVAMYINSGGFGAARFEPAYRQPDLLAGSVFGLTMPEDRDAMFGGLGNTVPAKGAYSLVMTNGYGDCYRMNMLRDRANYQAYRGICSYRGFSLSGCSTTGEVVMLRIKATPGMPEYFSLVSTSLRWGAMMYFLNDVFRPLNSWVMAGYENWYPFDMSCSVAMYINSGGFGATREFQPEPLRAAGRARSLVLHDGSGTNLIGALLPLSGDLADIGAAFESALNQALHTITNTPGMPPVRLVIADTRTDAATAYDQMVALRSNGCHIIIGPQTSEECRILKGYANEHDILLLSSSSTAVPLALPDDNLMRIAPDDSHQARVLADLLADDGVTDIAILSRTDIYGEGFMAAMIAEHNARGGVVFASNYCPRAGVFIPEIVSNMADQASMRAAARGVGRVGVVAILFDEGVDVMRAAADYPILGNVRWYGGDGMAQNNALSADAAAAGCAARTRYVCSIIGKYTNQLYDAVAETVAGETGALQVRPYAMFAYDALNLVAMALHEYGSTQTMAALIANIKTLAVDYTGCTGPVVFNACDDRADGVYGLYEFNRDGGVYAWTELTGKAPGAPGYVEASCGAYTDRIKLVWTSVSGADKYEIWGSWSPDFDAPSKLAETSDNEYVPIGAPADTHVYFQVRAVNDAGSGGFSRTAEGWAASVPGPCVRVNGSCQAVTLLRADAMSVTVDMHPGAHAGVEADWWLAACAPDGRYYYRDAFGEWRLAPGIAAMTPMWQGPLMDINDRIVFNADGLAAGEYKIYFGVDARDGILDVAHAWLSDINLTVY